MWTDLAGIINKIDKMACPRFLVVVVDLIVHCFYKYFYGLYCPMFSGGIVPWLLSKKEL